MPFYMCIVCHPKNLLIDVLYKTQKNLRQTHLLLYHSIQNHCLNALKSVPLSARLPMRLSVCLSIHTTMWFVLNLQFAILNNI